MDNVKSRESPDGHNIQAAAVENTMRPTSDRGHRGREMGLFHRAMNIMMAFLTSEVGESFASKMLEYCDCIGFVWYLCHTAARF